MSIIPEYTGYLKALALPHTGKDTRTLREVAMQRKMGRLTGIDFSSVELSTTITAFCRDAREPEFGILMLNTALEAEVDGMPPHEVRQAVDKHLQSTRFAIDVAQYRDMSEKARDTHAVYEIALHNGPEIVITEQALLRMRHLAYLHPEGEKLREAWEEQAEALGLAACMLMEIGETEFHLMCPRFMGAEYATMADMAIGIFHLAQEVSQP